MYVLHVCICKCNKRTFIRTYTVYLLRFSLALHQTLDIAFNTNTLYIVNNDYSLFTHL